MFDSLMSWLTGGNNTNKQALPPVNTSNLPANPFGNSAPSSMSSAQPALPSQPQQPSQGSVLGTQPSQAPAPAGATGGGGGGQQGGGYFNTVNNAVTGATNDQNAAAAAREAAARQSAINAYNTQVQGAETAKGQAGDQYNWLTNTLNQNKGDLLQQVTTNLNSGVANYNTQQDATNKQYDLADQDTLQNYRDIGQQQDAALRGAGVSNSSRALEAQFNLQNRMGRDLSGINNDKANAVSMIQNSIGTLKQKALDTQQQIETQASQQLNQAALQYKAQIDSINHDEQMSADQKAAGIQQAAAQLQSDQSNISSWAAGLKVQAAQTQAMMQQYLGGYMNYYQNQNSGLNTNLQQTLGKTQQTVGNIGANNPIQAGTTVQNPLIGGAYMAPNKNAQSTDLLSQGMMQPSMLSGGGANGINLLNPNMSNIDPLQNLLYSGQ